VHFSWQVTQHFRRKLPTVKSMSNQPPLWTWRMSQGLPFPKGVLSTDVSSASTPVSTCCSWLSPQGSWDVNQFSKQSTITLAFLFGWYVILKGPWTAVGTFGPSLFINGFTIGHKPWGVTSQFPTFQVPFYGPLVWWFWGPN
jgi:hypothetical protein